MQGEATNTSAVRFDARHWWLLALVCGVLFLDGLDVSMVGVALPSIGSELGLEPSSLQWVVSAYILGYGGLLLLGGRAADLLGRRRVLIGGLAVFLVARSSAVSPTTGRDPDRHQAERRAVYGAGRFRSSRRRSRRARRGTRR